MVRDVIFVKWGGAVITNKSGVKEPKVGIIRRLGRELRPLLDEYSILLGHGSGSFGHWAAVEYADLKRTNPALYAAKVHTVAAELNQIVVNELVSLGIPAISFPPSAIVYSRNDHPSRLCLGALTEVLRTGKYLPVTYGDAVADGDLGAAIYSTERVFFTLNPVFKPKRIVLVTSVDGVYTADPLKHENAERIPEITPDNFDEVRGAFGDPEGPDVTGGMLSKVETMLALVKTSPWLEEVIITSSEPGKMAAAIRGERVGTVIHR